MLKTEGTAAANDPATLAVLVEEAPYLKAQGVQTDWFDKVVAQAVPSPAAQIERRDKASQVRVALRHAISMVRDGIASGSPPVTLESLRPAIERLDPDA
jgi:hypothetical protein